MLKKFIIFSQTQQIWYLILILRFYLDFNFVKLLLNLMGLLPNFLISNSKLQNSRQCFVVIDKIVVNIH